MTKVMQNAFSDLTLCDGVLRGVFFGQNQRVDDVVFARLRGEDCVEYVTRKGPRLMYWTATKTKHSVYTAPFAKILYEDDSDYLICADYGTEHGMRKMLVNTGDFHAALEEIANVRRRMEA